MNIKETINKFNPFKKKEEKPKDIGWGSVYKTTHFGMKNK